MSFRFKLKIIIFFLVWLILNKILKKTYLSRYLNGLEKKRKFFENDDKCLNDPECNKNIQHLKKTISSHFPYKKKDQISKIIWQTWKDETFKKHSHESQMILSWTTKNKHYNHFFLTDIKSRKTIHSLFSEIPQIIEVYSFIKNTILEYDYFRYLILLSRGGTYTDLDTYCLKPINTWFPSKINNKNNRIGFVVGVEADPDVVNWEKWYSRRIQFCQWTFQSKSGHPILVELVARITQKLLTLKKEYLFSKLIENDFNIMNLSGPGIFTDVIFDYINLGISSDSKYTFKNFTKLRKPLVIKDVLFLPITSFSPDINHMGSKSHKHNLAYSKHFFLGSWKKKKKTQSYLLQRFILNLHSGFCFILKFLFFI